MKKKITKKSKPKAKKSSQTYPVRNWKEYNKSLINRGNLSVWISEEAIKNWHNLEKSGKKGASNIYSDLAIEASLMVKMLFKLDYRKTQGLVNSLFILMGLELSSPDYSTLCRGLPKLKVKLGLKDLPQQINLVIDSTGLKVYGEGEWKVRTHGWSKRRTWRKLHLAIEPESGQIVGIEATPNRVDDAEKVEDLLNQVPVGIKVEEVAADGAYDKKKTYHVLNQHGTKAVIPPRKNAKIWQHGNSKKERLMRDENLRRIRKVGRKTWKEEANYHQRSLAETGVFHFKNTFGTSVSSRDETHQYQELKLKGKILNMMTHLGMPRSEKVKGVTV